MAFFTGLLIGLLIGLVVGGFVGLLVSALAMIASDGGDRHDKT